MKDVVTKFYTAFKNLDAEAMSDCYHDDVVFADPAFGTLKGERAKNMWRMLCNSQKGKEFRVTFSEVSVNKNIGTAHWEAKYNFSKTGRQVHNIISAEFEFKDRLIIKHTDTFNLHKWATQALGFKGRIIGRTRYFKNKLQSQTNRLLDAYEAKQKSASN